MNLLHRLLETDRRVADARAETAMRLLQNAANLDGLSSYIEGTLTMSKIAVTRFDDLIARLASTDDADLATRLLTSLSALEGRLRNVDAKCSEVEAALVRVREQAEAAEAARRPERDYRYRVWSTLRGHANGYFFGAFFDYCAGEMTNDGRVATTADTNKMHGVVVPFDIREIRLILTGDRDDTRRIIATGCLSYGWQENDPLLVRPLRLLTVEHDGALRYRFPDGPINLEHNRHNLDYTSNSRAWLGGCTDCPASLRVVTATLELLGD